MMGKISETLYAKYIEDRLNAKVLEDDLGFIIYKIAGEECFIIDMKAGGNGRQLVDQLSQIAKNKNCKFISANIHLADDGANKTLISSLMVGFEVVRAEVGILSIVLKLTEGV